MPLYGEKSNFFESSLFLKFIAELSNPQQLYFTRIFPALILTKLFLLSGRLILKSQKSKIVQNKLFKPYFQVKKRKIRLRVLLKTII